MNIQKGCYAGRTETGFPFSCPSGQDCYMLHLLREDGEYWIHDMHYPMKAGSGILISPGTSYLFYCSDGSCNDDWICFQPEKGETLPFSLVCNTPFQPDDFENCATLIRQLLKENNAVPLPPPHAWTLPAISMHCFTYFLIIWRLPVFLRKAGKQSAPICRSSSFSACRFRILCQRSIP